MSIYNDFKYTLSTRYLTIRSRSKRIAFTICNDLLVEKKNIYLTQQFSYYIGADK